MDKSAKTASWSVRALIAGVSTLGLLAPPGCSSQGTPSLAPKSVKLPRTQKIAVIRLGDPTIEESSDADIEAGLKYAGIDPSSFTLTSRDARGDLTAVPGLVDAA